MTAKKTPAKKTPAKKTTAKKAAAKKAAPKKAAPKAKQFVDSQKFMADVLAENSEKVLAQIPDTIDIRAGKSWLKKFLSKLKK
jgi:hypothetical protein